VVTALLALAACGGGRNKGGVFASHRGAPDEFAVGRAAPLTVPPDFALVPPRPGQPRPQDADSSTQALNALFGGAQRASQGEQVLVQAAGNEAPPGIRSDVGATKPTSVNKGAATRTILSAPPSNNPQAEAATTRVTGDDAGGPGAATPPSGLATNPAGTAPQGTVPQL
jgi:hypothetical protein